MKILIRQWNIHINPYSINYIRYNHGMFMFMWMKSDCAHKRSSQIAVGVHMEASGKAAGWMVFWDS